MEIDKKAKLRLCKWGKKPEIEDNNFEQVKKKIQFRGNFNLALLMETDCVFAADKSRLESFAERRKEEDERERKDS